MGSLEEERVARLKEMAKMVLDVAGVGDRYALEEEDSVVYSKKGLT